MSAVVANNTVWSVVLVVLLLVVSSVSCGGDPAAPTDSHALPPPAQLTAEQDHQRMMDLLGIKALLPPKSGDPKAPHAANYDESLANPYPTLQDPLVLNNGRPVTSAKVWWKERRPELVAEFD